MNNPVIIGILAWFFPGAGHFAQGRTKRGIIVSAAIWLMFVVALFSGGAYYPGFDFKDGALLYMLNFFAKLGNGLGSIIAYIASLEPSVEVAARATFEYGGRYMETAGLLNVLAIMDALDIYFGRKR